MAKKPTQPTPAPTSGGFPVVKHLGEISKGRDVYHVRVLEVKGEHRLDVREYVDGDTYTGYTKKGIMLSADQFAKLKKLTATLKL